MRLLKEISGILLTNCNKFSKVNFVLFLAEAISSEMCVGEVVF